MTVGSRAGRVIRDAVVRARAPRKVWPAAPCVGCSCGSSSCSDWRKLFHRRCKGCPRGSARLPCGRPALRHVCGRSGSCLHLKQDNQDFSQTELSINNCILDEPRRPPIIWVQRHPATFSMIKRRLKHTGQLSRSAGASSSRKIASQTYATET